MVNLTVSINSSLLVRQIGALVEEAKRSPQFGRQLADLVAADVRVAKAESMLDGGKAVLCLRLAEPYERLLSQCQEQLDAISGGAHHAAGR